MCGFESFLNECNQYEDKGWIWVCSTFLQCAFSNVIKTIIIVFKFGFGQAANLDLGQRKIMSQSVSLEISQEKMKLGVDKFNKKCKKLRLQEPFDKRTETY